MDVKQIETAALEAAAAAADEQALDDVRVRFLGRKGEVTTLLKGLGQLTPEERPAAGCAHQRGQKSRAGSHRGSAECVG